MAFEAKDYPISDILNKAVYGIPRNQRRYVWRKEHWQDLFEDILFSISQEKPHFIGSIVLEQEKKRDGLSYYTIIDGQQRLTTITLVLVAIMKHFHEMEMKDDFLGTISYLQSKNNRNQDIRIIGSEYHLSLEKMIDGVIKLEDNRLSISAFTDIHTLSKAKDQYIGDAIKYFYYAIKEYLDSSDDMQEDLREIRAAVLDMTVVRIVSNSEEDSYTIFEILNARGQELAPHELLKNYIMRYIQPVERRDDAKIQWEDMERTVGSAMGKFIKHYATHRFGDTRNKYSSPYQAIQKATRGENISDLLDDIKLKSEYYDKIIHPTKGTDGNCDDIEYEFFVFFKKKRFEQFRPIFLSLLHQKELNNLSENKYNLILKYIYNFFVCFIIIGEEKSNKLEDVVFKYSRMLEEEYSESLVQEFCKNLKKKLPGYDWFLNSFKNIGWSNHFDLYKGEDNKNRVKIILETIEKFVSQMNDISIDYTLEHILPDADSIENAQIGNLIPLERRLNDRCGNKPLDEKYDIYLESNYRSARNIVSQYKGKEFSPKKRTEFMAKLMYNNILELNQFDYSNG